MFIGVHKIVITLLMVVLVTLLCGAADSDIQSPHHIHHKKLVLHHPRDKQHLHQFNDRQSPSQLPDNTHTNNSSHLNTHHQAKHNLVNEFIPNKELKPTKVRGKTSTLPLKEELIQKSLLEQQLSDEDERVTRHDEMVSQLQQKTFLKQGGLTDDLEGAPCSADTGDLDCLPLNFNDALYYDSPVVHAPYCQTNSSNSSSGSSSDEGYCTCGQYCVSRSWNADYERYFYYCGPCGRMGSSCTGDAYCNHTLSYCEEGYCSCMTGQYHDLYYCTIPYYGYEKALQVAIATCIFVAACLLAAAIYSSVYRRPQGRVHPYILRLLMRRANQGTRESPPGDTPPKYDDVVEQPPSYQQALELQEGEENPAFEGEGTEDNNNNNNNNSDDDNNGGDGSISKTDATNIRKGSRVSNDGITITVVPTRSSSNDDKKKKDTDSVSIEADDTLSDEYAREDVVRDTGAIPKQKSLTSIKKMKRTSPKQLETATVSDIADVSDVIADASAVIADVSDVPAGIESTVVDSSGDGDRRDSCGVDRESMGSLGEQPITLPLRMLTSSRKSTQL